MLKYPASYDANADAIYNHCLSNSIHEESIIKHILNPRATSSPIDLITGELTLSHPTFLILRPSVNAATIIASDEKL